MIRELPFLGPERRGGEGARCQGPYKKKKKKNWDNAPQTKLFLPRKENILNTTRGKTGPFWFHFDPLPPTKIAHATALAICKVKVDVCKEELQYYKT